MDPLDYLEEAGPSSATEMFSNGATRNRMDIDSSASDDELDDFKALRESLKTFCPKAATQFFEQYGLVSHQINSYNDFIKNGIQPIFDSIGEVIVEPSYDPSKKRDDEDWRHATLKFGKVTLDDPKLWVGEDFLSFNSGKEFLDMLPRHARLQNMTYSSKMNVEVHLEVYTLSRSRSDKFKTGVKDFVEKKTLNKYFSNVPFGKLPVMVQSDLCLMKKLKKKDCEFDQGGYFVIKGSEKTFIAQEQIYSKRLWVSKEDHTWTISYRSGSKMERVYVKLVPKLKRITGGEKILTVYFSATEVPIWILFFALGVPNDKEVVKLINLDAEDCTLTNILLESIYDADKKCEAFRKGDNSTKYIQKLMEGCRFPPSESVEECIKKYLFPSLKSFSQKAQFLAYMIKCLLEAYKGRRKVDNRNDFRNKRLELAAVLLERELRVHVKHMKRHMTKALQRDLHRELQSIDHYLDASIITNGLSRAFSTGAWSHPYKRIERVSGIVATLRRTNPLQAIADMRKTRQHVNYKRMVGDARYPHPSQWGKICFLSTPDGDNCGLVKNLASLGLVSTTITALEQESLLGELYQCGMENLVDNAKCLPDGKHKIFLDGDWVGTCRDSASFVAELRSKRRNMEIPHEVEIKRDEDHAEVRIFVDAGRILRPLIVVENLKKIQDLKREFKFEHLLEKGIVELIGAEEEEDCITAWGWRYLFSAKKETPPVNKKKYTHCELDSSFLLGLSCGIIPFANHDDAKRVLLQSEKYSQQAIGFPTTNAEIRADTSTHSLFYPQKPLFRTMLSDNLGKLDYAELKKKMLPHPEFFNGQCAIVAVNVHHGYNQEDSLVMNRASVERGMFRSEHTRSYKSEVENSEARGKKLKSGGLGLSFGKVKKSKIGRVDSLDDDGFPFVGANLLKGDIVIGKHDTSRVDHSIKLKHTEGGMVQRVILSSNDDGKNFAVVQLRQVRSPCIGDKFSSMHGQKGVVGILESQENFPFTKEGIVPDIVINPHAFPSRQTPGQLLEAALGKGIALGGGLKYATPFSTPSVDDIMAQLHSFKFSQWGHERVYDGRTGEKVESLIFVGPTFYQRLTHMAVDKVKYRNTGPVHSFTRQPVADRKMFGGLKFGEMERDGLIAHGAAANLQERVFTLSDPSQMHICGRCKNMANVIQRQPAAGGRKIRGAYCRLCKSGEDVVKVDVPYGAKLLCHELFSMGISLKFDTDDIC